MKCMLLYFDTASESMQKVGKEAFNKCISNQLHIIDKSKSIQVSLLMGQSIDQAIHL